MFLKYVFLNARLSLKRCHKTKILFLLLLMVNIRSIFCVQVLFLLQTVVVTILFQFFTFFDSTEMSPIFHFYIEHLIHFPFLLVLKLFEFFFPNFFCDINPVVLA
jgi:hypothetical protein